MRRFSDKRMASLKGLSLFQGFTSPDIYYVAEEKLHAGYVTYQKGRTILQQGKPVYALGCLTQGEADIGVIQPGKIGRRWLLLKHVTAPDCFGTAFAFAGRNCQIEVRARKKCEVCYLPGEKLMTEYEDPKVALVISRILPLMLREMKDMEEKLELLREPMLKGRIQRLFFMEAKKTDGDGQVMIPADRMNHEFLGVQRQALYRVLHEMEENGMITRKGSMWVLLQAAEKPPEQPRRKSMPLTALPEKKELETLMASCGNPKQTVKMLELLCKLSIQLEELNREIMLCQSDTARIRLLQYLVESKWNPDGELVSDTEEKLSSRLQVSRRMTEYVMDAMEAEGLIRREGNRTRVLLPRERIQELLVNELSGRDVSELLEVPEK